MVERAGEFLKVKLMDWAESWLLRLRQDHRPVSRALTDDEVSHLRGYFGRDLLSLVRVSRVDSIPNPPFFKSLPDLGLPVPWDFSADPGISLVDTVVLSEPLIPKDRHLSTLFLECVHIQQYQALGISKLVSRYVNGLFTNGFDFRNLPMERQARDLQLRYDAGLVVFSVEHEVEKSLLSGAI